MHGSVWVRLALIFKGFKEPGRNSRVAQSHGRIVPADQAGRSNPDENDSCIFYKNAEKGTGAMIISFKLQINGLFHPLSASNDHPRERRRSLGRLSA